MAQFDFLNNPEFQTVLTRLKHIGLPEIGGSAGKIPTVKGLKLLDKRQYADRVDVVLQFLEPLSVTSPVSVYRIYVTGAILKNENSSPFTVTQSPAKISIPITPTASGTITITVQTVLKNGFTSDISISPQTSFYVNSTDTPSVTSSFITNYGTLSSNGTVFATKQFPANYLNSNALLNFVIYGTLSYSATPSGGGLALYINGSPVVGAGITLTKSAGGADTVNFKFEAVINITSTTNARMSRHFIFKAPVPADYADVSPTFFNNNAVSISTTQNMDISLQFTIASGSPTMTVNVGYFQVINNI